MSARANWAKETISAGGAGNLTLSGAATTSNCTLNNAIGTNNPFTYLADDGTSKEIGIGYLSASTTLVRTTVLETLVSGTLSRNAPSALNLSTATTVSIVASAQTSVAPWEPYYFTNGNSLSGVTSLGSVDEMTTGFAVAINFLYAIPFNLPVTGYFTSASVYASTAGAAGSVLRIGIYADSATGVPGKLLKEFTSTAALDMTTTGAKTATPSAGIYLTAGYYHIVILAGVAAPTVKGPQYSPAGYKLGATGAQRNSGIIRAYTYAALPADETGNAYGGGGYGICSVYLK